MFYLKRIDLRRLPSLKHNDLKISYSIKSLTTVSSLFQPINLNPKNNEIKKGDSVAKSQKVLQLKFSLDLNLSIS